MPLHTKNTLFEKTIKFLKLVKLEVREISEFQFLKIVKPTQLFIMELRHCVFMLLSRNI